MHFRHHFVSSSDFVHRLVCVMTLRERSLSAFMAFPSLWSDVTATNRFCDRIIIFPTILGPISRPRVLTISENRGDPLLFSVWRPSSAKLQQTSGTCCPSEQLDHWATVWLIQSHSGLTMMDKAGEREWQSGPENDKKGWMKKKKNSGERDCIFGSTLPWPLAHFIFLLSVLLLNAVPPTAAVVSFFIVWYKMRLNQRVNGFTRLHMFFGAVEFLRKDCGLTFPSQPLSFSSRAQIVGQ